MVTNWRSGWSPHTLQKTISPGEKEGMGQTLGQTQTCFTGIMLKCSTQFEGGNHDLNEPDLLTVVYQVLIFIVDHVSVRTSF